MGDFTPTSGIKRVTILCTMLLVSENAALLERLRREERIAFEFLYRYHFPSVLRLVQSNSGSRADAEDLFQEALLVLVAKARQPDFALTASVKTFLYAISRNLWLKRLREQTRLQPLGDAWTELGEEPEEELEESRVERVSAWILKVSPGCRRLLRDLYWLDQTIEGIRQRVGYKNKHTASSMKNKCLEKMRVVAGKTLAA